MDCIDKDLNVKVQLKVNLSVTMSLRQTDCGTLYNTGNLWDCEINAVLLFCNLKSLFRPQSFARFNFSCGHFWYYRNSKSILSGSVSSTSIWLELEFSSIFHIRISLAEAPALP